MGSFFGQQNPRLWQQFSFLGSGKRQKCSSCHEKWPQGGKFQHLLYHDFICQLYVRFVGSKNERSHFLLSSPLLSQHHTPQKLDTTNRFLQLKPQHTTSILTAKKTLFKHFLRFLPKLPCIARYNRTQHNFTQGSSH